MRDLLTDPNDAAIAHTIVALAQSLGLSVIAEGVETAAQQDCLAVQGCLAYQGYLFSRPLPITDFERLLEQDNATKPAVLALETSPAKPPLLGCADPAFQHLFL